ncbi:HNM1-Choline permease, partial [Colletotrichum asianum]
QKLRDTVKASHCCVSALPLGGGPAFGLAIRSFVGFCCATSLAELASAFPHSGGQHLPVSQLAPKRIKSFLSCTIVIFSWAGAIYTSGTLVAATNGLAAQPDPRITFLVYQIITVTTCSFDLFESLLGLAAKGSLFFCLASQIVMFMALLSFSPTKQTAKTVFVDFENTSGWPIGLACFLGSRMACAFARNKGFPFHRYLAAIAPAPFHTQIWAHLWSCIWASLIGAVYLGPRTAFNSFVSTGKLFKYMTYAVPIVLMIWNGRNNLANGHLLLSKFGLVANIAILTRSFIALDSHIIFHLRPAR